MFIYRTRFKRSTSNRRKKKSGSDLRWEHLFLFRNLAINLAIPLVKGFAR